MKKLVLLSLVVFVGYVVHADWQRLKKEVELRSRVEKLLATVPYNARGLNAVQFRQLGSIVAGQGFKFAPKATQFETHASQMQPMGAPQFAKYTDHTLHFTYTRSNTFLPFLEEEYKTSESVLVLIPNATPAQRIATQMEAEFARQQEMQREYNEKGRKIQADMEKGQKEYEKFQKKLNKRVKFELSEEAKKRMELERQMRAMQPPK